MVQHFEYREPVRDDWERWLDSMTYREFLTTFVANAPLAISDGVEARVGTFDVARRGVPPRGRSSGRGRGPLRGGSQAGRPAREGILRKRSMGRQAN